MKKIITILDGAFDDPLEGKTPLMTADIHHINNLLGCGDSFRLATVLKGEDINSKFANMTILGVKDRDQVPKRPVLEALALGLDIPEGSFVSRLNLLSLDDAGCVESTVGSGITSAEHIKVKQVLSELLTPLGIAVYDLAAHAFILVSKAPLGGLDTINIMGEVYHNLVNEQPRHYALVREIERYLLAMPCNARRKQAGKIAINSALIWDESPYHIKPQAQRARCAVVTATPIVKALAIYMGYDVFTKSSFDAKDTTDLVGKALLSAELLRDYDMVFCHIDGLDDVSHKRERDKKVAFLNRIDAVFFGTLLEAAPRDEALEFIVLPDHGTSSLTGAHMAPVVAGFSATLGGAAIHKREFNEQLAKDQLILTPKAWRDFLFT